MPREIIKSASMFGNNMKRSFLFRVELVISSVRRWIIRFADGN